MWLKELWQQETSHMQQFTQMPYLFDGLLRARRKKNGDCVHLFEQKHAQYKNKTKQKCLGWLSPPGRNKPILFRRKSAFATCSRRQFLIVLHEHFIFPIILRMEWQSTWGKLSGCVFYTAIIICCKWTFAQRKCQFELLRSGEHILTSSDIAMNAAITKFEHLHDRFSVQFSRNFIESTICHVIVVWFQLFYPYFQHKIVQHIRAHWKWNHFCTVFLF